MARCGGLHWLSPGIPDQGKALDNANGLLAMRDSLPACTARPKSCFARAAMP
jgi:hypothetical protein